MTTPNTTPPRTLAAPSVLGWHLHMRLACACGQHSDVFMRHALPGSPNTALATSVTCPVCLQCYRLTWFNACGPLLMAIEEPAP